MNLIFDFDGTICDSFDAMYEIIIENFPELNASSLSKEQVRQLGVKNLMKKSDLSLLQVAKIVAVGRAKMENYIPKLKLFPKFKEVAKILSQKHTLGILTSNSQKNVNDFLMNNQLEKYFVFVHSERDLFGKSKKLKKLLKKYNLDRNETYYIGDETRDVEAAKKAGVGSVAVTWGGESKTLLQRSNPDIILERVEDLLNIEG